MCRSFRNILKGMGLPALVVVTGIELSTSARAAGSPSPEILANTCNSNSELSYPTAPNFVAIGSTVRVVITLGAGGIQGGTALAINRVRFNLDCQSQNLGINCPDDGPVVSFQGNVSSTCGVTFTTPQQPGDFLPNHVVFTPSTPVLIPANQLNFCTLSFDTKLESVSNDDTPNVIEEVAGYDAATADGVCNTVPPLASGDTNSASYVLCPPCDDGNQCNGIEACDPDLGCQAGTPIACNDNDVCTSDTCDPNVLPPFDPCIYTPGAQGECDDNDSCTFDFCDPILGCQHTPGAQGDCDDDDVCTADACDPVEGCVHSPPFDCNDQNECTDETCDPVEGCVYTDNGARCDDDNSCTDDSCDPETGCVNEPNGNPECSLPCRITGGGLVFENTGDVITDPSLLAEIQHASFGGQVGAPFGLVGCHDDFDQIQGEWTHIRHKHRGSFHAADYNSLVCGCDDGQGGPGVLDGNLCNPGDRETGPEPRRAPANIACWTGVGNYNPTHGRRMLLVAFRVEVEDRGEPGAGRNAGNLEDVYRIRIWIPTNQEDVNALADAACCTNAIPDIRLPDVSDGGNLIHGNLQIHPPTGNPNNP